MDQAEYSEWMEFYRRDPFGDQRADMRMANTIVAILKAANPKNNPKLADLMLFPEPEPELSPEEWEREQQRRLIARGG